jgi:hypothetical protein
LSVLADAGLLGIAPLGLFLPLVIFVEDIIQIRLKAARVAVQFLSAILRFGVSCKY